MTDSARLVHIVDDDEAVRRSASLILRALRMTVKTYASGIELLDALPDIAPGCILLDVRMPGMDGLELQAELRAKGVFLPVIVMTGHGDIKLAVRAIKTGAVDFIEKPFERSVLLSALDSGFARLDREQCARGRGEQARARIAGLTRREREVLAGLVRGHPNKRIAYDLGISPRTVEIHRANLMAKLGAASLSEALRLAFAGGMGDGAHESP